jgi:hypothetical protein
MNVRWLAATVATGVVCAAAAGGSVWWFMRDTGTSGPDRVVGNHFVCDSPNNPLRCLSGHDELQIRTDRGTTYTVSVPDGTVAVLGMTWPDGRLNEPRVIAKSGLWCHLVSADGSNPNPSGPSYGAQCQSFNTYLLRKFDSWWTLTVKDRDGHDFAEDVPEGTAYKVGDIWKGN